MCKCASIYLMLYKNQRNTGWAISPCTPTVGGGSGLSPTGLVLRGLSDNSWGLLGGIHITYWQVALLIGMQQAILQIIPNMLRAGTALPAILARRGGPRRLVFRPKLFIMLVRAPPFHLESRFFGCYVHRRR
jgi:hypothetical protein